MAPPQPLLLTITRDGQFLVARVALDCVKSGVATIFRADCYDSVLAELLDNQIAATTQARIRRFAMGWYEAGYRDGLAHRRHHTEFPGQI